MKAYINQFTERKFWAKIGLHAQEIGRETLFFALKLYFAMRRPETPAWAKSVILSALGYFIFPLDSIPDVIPGVGFVDDFGVLSMAIATVAMYIDDDVVEKANVQLARWLGADAEGADPVQR